MKKPAKTPAKTPIKTKALDPRAPLWNIPIQAAKDWLADDALHLAAAISFYTVFAMAPLILILTAVTAFVFGSDAAYTHVGAQVEALMGKQGRDVFASVTESAKDPGSGIAATIIGAVTLLIGASAIFGELQGALNKIWEIEPRPGRGIRRFIRTRLLSFALVFATAFLLIVSLAVSTTLSTFTSWAEQSLLAPAWVLVIANLTLSFVVITVLFATIYKFLPDAIIDWREVWLGAAATSLLFAIGKWLIGLYLARASVASAYGAAGSLVAALVWVYYSSMIFLYGAELTQVHARLLGAGIRPSRDAQMVTDAKSA